MSVQQKIHNCYLDTEFNRVGDKYVNPVCAVWTYKGKTHRIWTHNRKDEQHRLAQWFYEHQKEMRVVCFGVNAEARFLEACGVDTTYFRFTDLYIEGVQLKNSCDAHKYGRYLDTIGVERISVPPSRNPVRNRGKDMSEIKGSLNATVGNLFGVNLGAAYKDKMRKLIIEDRPRYTHAEQAKILGYCESDIKYLSAIHKRQVEELVKLTGWSIKKVMRAQDIRGRTVNDMTWSETIGIPIAPERVHNLSTNVDKIKNEIISNLCKEHYPFYERNKKGVWVKKADAWTRYLTENKLTAKWPKTKSGYKCDEKTLDMYDGVPALYALKSTMKILGQIKWFREEAYLEFLENVDPNDLHLRCWLNPYGTQTGRNAPKAKKFIPAMSNWLRCLMQPPKGWEISEMDQSAQEFAIAAILSEDDAMIEAYVSGDPYAWFAKQAGAIPKDANNDWVKDWKEAPEKLQPEYKSYSIQRGLFKATVLGLQYGMGIAKLAVKLTADTGTKVSEAQATKLRNLHKRIFHRMWDWKASIQRRYDKGEPLVLADGWVLFCDNPVATSVQNFPVQGTGAAILHETMRNLRLRSIPVTFPLHDAVYVIHPAGESEKIKRQMKQCWDAAVKTILKTDVEIRTEGKTITHDQPWVEGKGRKMYDMLSKYLHEETE